MKYLIILLSISLMCCGKPSQPSDIPTASIPIVLTEVIPEVIEPNIEPAPTPSMVPLLCRKIVYTKKHVVCITYHEEDNNDN